MDGICRKTLKRFDHNGKGFATDEEVAKFNKTVVETANSFSLVWVRMALRSS